MTDEVKADHLQACEWEHYAREAESYVFVSVDCADMQAIISERDAKDATIRALQADLQSVRRLTIKYHGLGMKDSTQWRVGLEEIASVVAEEGAEIEPDTRDAAALQAENERLREVLGKINAIEDAEYPSEDEYGYESCHVEGYNAGLSECRKTILLALKDTPND